MSLNLIVLFIFFLICILLFIYRIGKFSKENEIMKDNIKIKSKYENNKNHINNSESLGKKLKSGNY